MFSSYLNLNKYYINFEKPICQIFTFMMKKLITIITLLFLTNCYSQKKFPSHWKLEGLNRKPKKMIEFVETKIPENNIFKYVHFFDKNGYIQKIEVYLLIDDEYELSSIKINKKIDNSSFKSTSYNGYYEEISSIGSEKFIDNTIHSQYEIKNFPLVFATTKKLDKKHRVLEWTDTSTNSETNEVNYTISRKFLYHKKRISKIIVYDGKEKTTQTLFVRNEKLDKHSNFLYQELVTEDSKLHEITKREYVYY